MSDFYVDSNSGSNGDNGTTQALAWATIEYALESGALSAGDIVWVRRTHVEYSGAPTSNIVMAYSGTRSSPILIIGWPKASILDTIITSASWINGSTTVDLVVGVTLSRTAHCGRWATAPNGSKFLITRIIDSNTLIIDREYSGATVTTTDGKFQIEADEDYADRPTDVDGWDSDAHGLPLIDFADASYYISGNSNFFVVLKNLEIRDSASLGLNVTAWTVVGCLFHNDNDIRLVALTSCFVDRCIFEGSGTGSSQYGGLLATCVIKNSAIYNMGSYGMIPSVCYLENVNIGVEVVNQGADILFNSSNIWGRDVKLGSTTKISTTTVYPFLNELGVLSIENYQKILGDHLVHPGPIAAISKDVVAGSGDPYKRTGGADKIIEVDCSHSDAASDKEHTAVIFTHEFETDTTSKSYRYYVQCKDLSLAATELWLEVEYVDSYDDTSEYTITKVESDETCSLRSGVSDWTQYIEVTGIQPAVASKVRIKCFVAKYDADGYIYIDPLPVVT